MKRIIYNFLFLAVRALCGAALMSTAAFVFFGKTGALVGGILGVLVGVFFGWSLIQKHEKSKNADNTNNAEKPKIKGQNEDEKNHSDS